MPLYAGIAETNITPPLGVWMCGYAFRPCGCVAVHDELWARALVVAGGDNRVALVTMDLLGLDFDLVEKVRQGVGEQTGIPPEAVMLHATHTHGGPNVRRFNTMGSRDEPYVEMLVRKLIGAVKQAAERLEPASLSYGRAPAQIGINRRQIGPDGKSEIGVNPAGPVAPYVDVLAVNDSRGAPRAILFSHACHPTTLSGDNLEITADWPGFACEAVRRATGAMPFFLQGCCGNINPHPRGTYELARRHGETIAGAALEAVNPASCKLTEDVRFREVAVDLPLNPPPPVEECERNVAHWQAQVESEKKSGNVGRILHAEGLRDFAAYERVIAGEEDPKLTRAFHIQALDFGGLRILGLPAEMFVQYQLDFSQQSDGPVIALGYTNGVHGYVPTAADYPFGGYEVEGSHRYYGTLSYAPASELLIRDAAYDLLEVEDPDRSAYRTESAGL